MLEMLIISNPAMPLWHPGLTRTSTDFYTVYQDPAQASMCEQSEVHRLILF